MQKALALTAILAVAHATCPLMPAFAAADAAKTTTTLTHAPVTTTAIKKTPLVQTAAAPKT